MEFLVIYIKNWRIYDLNLKFGFKSTGNTRPSMFDSIFERLIRMYKKTLTLCLGKGNRFLI